MADWLKHGDSRGDNSQCGFSTQRLVLQPKCWVFRQEKIVLDYLKTQTRDRKRVN